MSTFEFDGVEEKPRFRVVQVKWHGRFKDSYAYYIEEYHPHIFRWEQVTVVNSWFADNWGWFHNRKAAIKAAYSMKYDSGKSEVIAEF